MHRIQWLSPLPLWNEFASSADRAAFRRPAILRFAGDNFMEDFLSTLAQTPENIAGFVARAETWREPISGLKTAAPAVPQGQTPPVFKLYQPVQSRFYLVAASLTCRLPGLPDHAVRTGAGEAVTFMVRRIEPKREGITDFSKFVTEDFDEYAWVDPEQAPRWVKVQGPGLMAAEEQLPMSPSEFDEQSRKRRIFSGLIPTSRRQQYITGRAGKPKIADDPSSDAPPEDPRKVEFLQMVVEPWALLLEWYLDPRTQALTTTTERETSARQSSAFILLDFADYLQKYFSRVSDAMRGQLNPAQLLPSENSIYSALGAVDNSLNIALRDAIVNAKNNEAALQAVTSETGLPAGVYGFRLTQPVVRALIQAAANARPPIQQTVEDALPPFPAGAVSPFRLPARTPARPQGDAWFIVRCVLTQPQCGEKARAVVSDPSLPFQMASFFDADAPARNIQIALPVDTSPGSLRKFDKNVAFLISDELSRQMGRASDLKKLMEGETGGPGIGLGWICSFSIPIITIVAFILLFIFVILLNIVFWWIAFFKICFPVPALKAKG